MISDMLAASHVHLWSIRRLRALPRTPQRVFHCPPEEGKQTGACICRSDYRLLERGKRGVGLPARQTARWLIGVPQTQIVAVSRLLEVEGPHR